MNDEALPGGRTDDPSSTVSSFNLLPSSFPIVPLAVPYWNGATYGAITRCFATARIINGPDLSHLREQIRERLGVADAALCGSGSLALELALRACEVGEGDEVIIPTFCCSAVVPPILAVGATPVLAEVGDELNLTVETVGAALTRKTKAIIVPHLFGNPAEIESIIELVHGKNIRVIDDAAQALGATINGQATGSFGDVGVLSFGAEKMCSGLGGGVLVSRWPGAALAHSSGLAQPRPIDVFRKLLSTLLLRRWRRWTSPAQKLFSVATRKSPDTPATPYSRERMANLNAAAASSLLATLDENIAARRARVFAYRDLLGGDARVQLISHRAGSACLTQVMRVPPRRRRDLATFLITALGRAGYEVQGSYVPIHLLASYPNCVWDRLPNAERVWADLIELPCEPSVSLNDIERIAFIVGKTVAEGDNCPPRCPA